MPTCCERRNGIRRITVRCLSGLRGIMPISPVSAESFRMRSSPVKATGAIDRGSPSDRHGERLRTAYGNNTGNSEVFHGGRTGHTEHHILQGLSSPVRLVPEPGKHIREPSAPVDGDTVYRVRHLYR